MDRGGLKKVCLIQLKIGTIGFGGPLATMALMRDELVEREKLVSPDRYLQGLGVVKLLPGPVSTLLAVFLGQEVAGPLGGALSALCFILPAFLMLLAIALLESALGPTLLQSAGFRGAMGAVQAAVLGIILFNCWKLFKDAYDRGYAGKTRPGFVVVFAVAAAVAAWLRVHEPIILIAAGALGWGALRARQPILRLDPFTIFVTFFTAGLTVFGTGYMVLPYLQRVLVSDHGWISTQAFLDGVAYGNLTPGPVVIASTYFGFKMLGLSGALAATIGIFLGPVLLMLAFGPVFRKFLGQPWIEGVLMGLLPSVAATIAISVIFLGQGIEWNWVRVVLGVAALGLSVRKVAAWKILFGAAAIGVFS